MTTIRQKSKYCPTCKRTTLHMSAHEPPKAGCLGHAVMTVITCGLWLPIAVLCMGLASVGRPLSSLAAAYRCQVCGRKAGPWSGSRPSSVPLLLRLIFLAAMIFLLYVACSM